MPSARRGGDTAPYLVTHRRNDCGARIATHPHDLELKRQEEPDERPPADAIVRAVKEQLGLELTTATRAVEVVVVELMSKEKSRAAKG